MNEKGGRTMKAHVLTGSKQQIAEKVAEIDGEVHEAIVFIEEPSTSNGLPADIFEEMESFTVRQMAVDDSRQAIYRRMEGE
jgi:hypothetical protein